MEVEEPWTLSIKPADQTLSGKKEYYWMLSKAGEEQLAGLDEYAPIRYMVGGQIKLYFVPARFISYYMMWAGDGGWENELRSFTSINDARDIEGRENVSLYFPSTNGHENAVFLFEEMLHVQIGLSDADFDPSHPASVQQQLADISAILVKDTPKGFAVVKFDVLDQTIKSEDDKLLHVKLHSNHVTLQNGGSVYIRSDLAEYWASHTNLNLELSDEGTAFEPKADTIVGNENAYDTRYHYLKAKCEHVNIRRFRARNQYGNSIVFKFDYYPTASQWKGWYKKAVGSNGEAYTIVRAINPVIPIYIVPFAGVDFEALDDIMKKLDKRVENREVIATWKQLHSIKRRSEINANYIQIGVSPFRHYETWIDAGAWSVYNEGRKDRAFPTKEDLVALKSKIEKEFASPKLLAALHHEDDDGRWSKFVKVTHTRIQEAEGQRSKVRSQKTAMGGISATEVAELLGWLDAKIKADGFGVWPRMINTAAEWLHRSAFSWGGIGGNPWGPDYETSQLQQNLIFGTSECNAQMCRFEKAWQSFVTKEAERRIDSNLPEVETVLSTNIRPDLSNENFPRTKFVEERLSAEYNEVSWLSYAMEYRLTVSEPTGLNGNATEYKTTFLPFSRGFFTFYEKALDEYILFEAYAPDGAKFEPENEDIETDGEEDESQVEMLQVYNYPGDNVQDDPLEKLIKIFAKNKNDLYLPSPPGDGSDLILHQFNAKTVSDEYGYSSGDFGEQNYEGECLISESDHAANEFEDNIVDDDCSALAVELDEQSEEVTIEALAIDLSTEEGFSTHIESITHEDFNLFGVIQVTVSHIESKAFPGYHQIVSIPQPLSIGKLIPSFAESQLNMISILDTKFYYRSEGTALEPQGLGFSTTVTFSGFLEPINNVLCDIFQQKNPSLNMSGHFRAGKDWMSKPPGPADFTLRGELPGLDISIFTVLSIKRLGIDLMGIRKGSQGGYDFSYGFFGTGRISKVEVNWYIRKSSQTYMIMAVTQSETWKNLGDCKGLDLENVRFQASWTGTKTSTIRLNVEANLALGNGTLLVEGAYSNDELRLACTLEKCTLKTLQDFYKKLFGTEVHIATDHEITFNQLSVEISTKTGLILKGSITIDNHSAETVSISLDKLNGITINGKLNGFTVADNVEILNPALNLTIGPTKLNLAISGKLIVKNHQFTVSVYLNKVRGKNLQYTVYGAYSGELFVHDVMDGARGTIIDVGLKDLAICVSNMDKPNVMVEDKVLSYTLQRGFQIYAKAMTSEAMNELFKFTEPQPIVLSLMFKPGKSLADSEVTMAIELPTTGLINFPPVSSGPLILRGGIREKNAFIEVEGELRIELPKEVVPKDESKAGEVSVTAPPESTSTVVAVKTTDQLILSAKLKADLYGASGSGTMTGSWKNPLGKCRDLAIKDIHLGIGINYVQFSNTGSLSEFCFAGALDLGDFQGVVAVFVGIDPTKQLLSVKLKNLNLSKVVQFINQSLEMGLPIAEEKDILIIHNLELCICTAEMEVNKVAYIPGVMFDVDMTILGKSAQISGQLNKDVIEFHGTVDPFFIGDVEVTSYSGSSTVTKKEVIDTTANFQDVVDTTKPIDKKETDNKTEGKDAALKETKFEIVKTSKPSIDLTLSKASQSIKIKVSGKVIIGQNNLMVRVDIDPKEPRFELEFHLNITNALKIDVVATMKEESKDQQSDSLATKIISSSGDISKYKDLANREFEFSALVQQDLMNYVMDTTNNYFEHEGSADMLPNLLAEVTDAEANLEYWKGMAQQKRDFFQTEMDAEGKIILETEAKLKADVSRLTLEIERNEELKAAELSALTLQHDEETDAVVEDGKRGLFAVKKSIKTALSEWTGFEAQLEILEKAKTTVDRLEKPKDLAKEQLQIHQSENILFEAQKPEKDSIDHDAWRMREIDREKVLSRLQIKYDQASLEYEAAELRYDEVEHHRVTKRTMELQTGTLVNLSNTYTDRQKELELNQSDLKRRQKLDIEKVEGIYDPEIGKLKKELVRAEKELNDYLAISTERLQTWVDKKLKAMSYESLVDSLNKAYDRLDKARIELKAYSLAKNALVGFVGLMTKPHRTLLKLAKVKPFNVHEMSINGTWSGMVKNQGKIKIRLKGTIVFKDFDEEFEFDIASIVSFFVRLWEWISEIIPEALGKAKQTLVNLAREFDKDLGKGMLSQVEQWEYIMDQIDNPGLGSDPRLRAGPLRVSSAEINEPGTARIEIQHFGREEPIIQETVAGTVRAVLKKYKGLLRSLL